jgi:tetratricopeptide (TPR) repeat protein
MCIILDASMRLGPLLGLALPLSMLAPGPVRGQDLPEALVPVFNQGVQAMKAGRLAEAERAFRDVLGRGGARAYVHHNLSLVLQQAGRHEKAVAEARAALALDPAFLPARIVLGSSLLALGRAPEAVTELEQAVTRAPTDRLARLQLARACEATARWPQAVEQYRALKEMAPKDPEHAYALGRAYLRLAEWSLETLKKEYPRSPRLLQALGHNYRVQGKPDDAIRAFERAARADPTLPEIHLALAQVHLEQGRYDDARREVEAELGLVPESAGARALLDRLEKAAPRRP